MDNEIMKKGAILSKSVAINRGPIFFAERSDAVDEADSGWQFLGDEDAGFKLSDAQIWAISEVVDYEPTLLKYMKMPVGTRLIRETSSSGWKLTN